MKAQVLTTLGAAVSMLVLVASVVFGLRLIEAVDSAAGASEAATGPSPSSVATGADATPDDRTPATPLPTPSTGSASEGWGARIDELLPRARVSRTHPDVAGYDRDCGPGDGCVFGPEWSDATGAPDSRNGCDTRNDVLGASLSEVEFDPGSPGCDVVDGILRDPYTGARMDYATEGSEIHIDHIFPLAAAWDLGAADWPAARRATFANDTAYELIAVSGTANLSKGDSTPASWLPPLKGYRCEYVARYLDVAVAYDLAITRADVRVIGFVRRKC